MSARLHLVIALRKQARGNAAEDDQRESKHSDQGHTVHGFVAPTFARRLAARRRALLIFPPGSELGLVPRVSAV